VTRPPFTFNHRLRVRWAEVDRQDVVFNANYFLYFDVAVSEYWHAIGLDYPHELVTSGTDLFAVKASAEFHGAATYDDWLDIHMRCARLGRSSMQLLIDIYRGDEHLTSGELVYVNVDIKTKKSAALPESLRERIQRYESTAPNSG
jgi:acyl-CoA thioester hydrolase